MRSLILVVAAVFSALIVERLLVTPRTGEAQAGGIGVAGAGDAGEAPESLTWKNLKGAARSESISRLVLKVPKSYGELFQVSGAQAHVLWFVDANGVIRNVHVGTKLVRIEREGP